MFQQVNFGGSCNAFVTLEQNIGKRTLFYLVRKQHVATFCCYVCTVLHEYPMRVDRTELALVCVPLYICGTVKVNLWTDYKVILRSL